MAVEAALDGEGVMVEAQDDIVLRVQEERRSGGACGEWPVGRGREARCGCGERPVGAVGASCALRGGSRPRDHRHCRRDTAGGDSQPGAIESGEVIYALRRIVQLEKKGESDDEH